jgi:hypothetical protein
MMRSRSTLDVKIVKSFVFGSRRRWTASLPPLRSRTAATCAAGADAQIAAGPTVLIAPTSVEVPVAITSPPASSAIPALVVLPGLMRTLQGGVVQSVTMVLASGCVHCADPRIGKRTAMMMAIDLIRLCIAVSSWMRRAVAHTEDVRQRIEPDRGLHLRMETATARPDWQVRESAQK